MRTVAKFILQSKSLRVYLQTDFDIPMDVLSKEVIEELEDEEAPSDDKEM